MGGPQDRRFRPLKVKRKSGLDGKKSAKKFPRSHKKNPRKRFARYEKYYDEPSSKADGAALCASEKKEDYNKNEGGEVLFSLGDLEGEKNRTAKDRSQRDP